MTESDYWYSKSSREANHMDLQQEGAMTILIEQQEYGLFAMLKPKLTKDGGQWCALYGENLQEGIAGFGDTPYLAILDFNKAFNKK
jgi:hypothetical protein